jgi:hypothetical protein
MQTATPPAKSPPWVSSLELWLVLGLAVLAVARLGRLIEWHAVISHTIRENTERAIAYLATERDEARRRAEWMHYAKKTPQQLAAEARKRKAQIDRLADWAKTLFDQAERWEASWFHIPRHVAYLRARADFYADAGHIAQNELIRLEALWGTIEAARAVQRRDDAIANALNLLHLLDSTNDAAASAALAKLYSLRNSIDWLDLVPGDLPLPVRAQAAKFLRVAAGTTSIGEARAALQKLKRLCKEHGIPFERMAA